ncbi:MAG: arginine deiminase family protein [Candidatus Rifleibacteriota bacterium]
MNTAQNKFEISVRSEIGELEGVILHTPGLEIENMTPMNVERALYSDILNLSVASLEYQQLEMVLNKITSVFQVKNLLERTLQNSKVKQSLIENICRNEAAEEIKDQLLEMAEKDLARCLVEGVLLKKNNLSRFLSKERYSLRPLHNFFYTRDSAIAINDWVLISQMANKVRAREAMIMEAIFDFHPMFATKTVGIGNQQLFAGARIEGGDVLVARNDVLLIGIGARTNPQAVDFLIDHFCKKRASQHIIVQELPQKPESFIHLDMVFTLLDRDTCMIYEPVILQPNMFRTVHIAIENGEVTRIDEKQNLLTALENLGMELAPISCGGKSDPWMQEREQWHSGANFFAIAPGKIIGYRRNINTIEELDRKGFAIIEATDVAEDKTDLSSYGKCVITIDGSELARGGGGCRCMTMPIRRKNL